MSGVTCKYKVTNVSNKVENYNLNALLFVIIIFISTENLSLMKIPWEEFDSMDLEMPFELECEMSYKRQTHLKLLGSKLSKLRSMCGYDTIQEISVETL